MNLALQALDGESVTEILGTIETVLEYAGTVAFALSGALLASRKRMDLVGVVSLGVIVSIGGGTIRDLLLQQPVSWIEDPAFFVVGFVTALLTIPAAKIGGQWRFKRERLDALFRLGDGAPARRK